MGAQLKASANAEGQIKNVTPRGALALKRNEQLVYDALNRSRLPLKAYELLEQLQDDGLKAPMTIYRALEALIAQNCVKKIESLNAFVAVGFTGKASAYAFLICRKCMHTKKIELNDRQVADLFSPACVSAQNIRIEAFGDCHQVCENPDE